MRSWPVWGNAPEARSLNIVLKSIEQRVKILQSLGLMEKVPEEVLLGDLVLRQASDSEAESALAFLRALQDPEGPFQGPRGACAARWNSGWRRCRGWPAESGLARNRW